MAFCPPPQLLSTDTPIFDPDDPGLESIVGQDLGDFESFLSGLDALLSVPLAAYTLDVDALAAYDVLLTAARFTAGAFDSAYIAPLFAELATLQASGDVLAVSIAASVGIAPSFPVPPAVPPVPILTPEVLCGACGSGGGGGGGNESPPPTQDPQPCPGYGYITTPCTPVDATPTPPTNSPIPPADAGCLNPSTGGGYVAGPCPVGPSPLPTPEPPAPPPVNPPEPPAPPPDLPPADPTPAPDPPVELPPDPAPTPDPVPDGGDGGGDSGGGDPFDDGGGGGKKSTL
jgi:hypothetical protein